MKHPVNCIISFQWRSKTSCGLPPWTSGRTHASSPPARGASSTAPKETLRRTTAAKSSCSETRSRVHSSAHECGNVSVNALSFAECLKGLFHDKMLIKVGDTGKCREAMAKLIEASRMDVDSDVPLRDACSVDLSKFCRDISATHSRGEKISCLRNVLEDKNLKLEPRLVNALHGAILFTP